MIGYCPKCKEYRSDDGSDAWGFIWKNGMPICKRCGHLVDLFNKNKKKGINKNTNVERIKPLFSFSQSKGS